MSEFHHVATVLLVNKDGELILQIYGLQDDSALVVNGDDQKFIGSEPYRVI